MELQTVQYERRPLQQELDETTKTFMHLLENIAVETNQHWSFVGGFARDIWLKKKPNDYDVCVLSISLFKEELKKIGVLSEGEQVDREIPHDMYFDPYAFSKKEHPIHWIQAENEWAFAPTRFDFSINQICLKSDGYFYAPTYTWRDLDKGIIRRTSQRLTSNLVFRAIRFACKYNFDIHPKLKDDIKEITSERIGTDIFLRNLQKMVDDGVGDACFELMKEWDFREMERVSSMEELIHKLNNMILRGEGYRERYQPYNDW